MRQCLGLPNDLVKIGQKTLLPDFVGQKPDPAIAAFEGKHELAADTVKKAAEAANKRAYMVGVIYPHDGKSPCPVVGRIVRVNRRTGRWSENKFVAGGGAAWDSDSPTAICEFLIVE